MPTNVGVAGQLIRPSKKSGNDTCKYFFGVWTYRNRRFFDGLSTLDYSLKSRCLLFAPFKKE